MSHCSPETNPHYLDCGRTCPPSHTETNGWRFFKTLGTFGLKTEIGVKTIKCTSYKKAFCCCVCTLSFLQPNKLKEPANKSLSDCCAKLYQCLFQNEQDELTWHPLSHLSTFSFIPTWLFHCYSFWSMFNGQYKRELEAPQNLMPRVTGGCFTLCRSTNLI